MRIAKKTRRSVAHELLRFLFIAISAVATRPEFFLAKETFPAANGKWDNHAVTFLKFLDSASYFYHRTHWFMTQDVAFFHRWHVMIVKVQVRSADGGGCNLYNDITWILDDRIRNRVATHVPFAVPN